MDQSKESKEKDALFEGRDENFMDIDRMINEGLGGGQITTDNGLIEDTTTDTMNNQESLLEDNEDMVIEP